VQNADLTFIKKYVIIFIPKGKEKIIMKTFLFILLAAHLTNDFLKNFLSLCDSVETDKEFFFYLVKTLFSIIMVFALVGLSIVCE
jgi:hypothetical protein